MRRQPLTVLHFTITTARGGVEEHILLHLQGLDRRRFRPVLACPPVLIPALGQDIPSDVEVIPFDRRSPNRMTAAFRFCRILRQQRVDILHSHMFQASRLASPLGRMCGVPLIIETSHGRESWRKGIKANHAVDRFAGRFVDRYIAVSNAIARYLVETKGLPEEKIQVIHNGVDMNKFEPSLSERLGMKKALGIAEGDPVLLVVGRLEPQKGHQILLEAMAKIRGEFPDAKLICLGDGALRGKLTESTEKLSLESAVRFVGFQNNVREWLAMADISVLPSFYEGLPLSAIESLAAGRPMVATAVDGTPEVVIHEKTGLTVPPGDPTAMAEAICRLLRDPGWAKQLAEVGREYVISEFSLDRFARKTQEFYLESLRMISPRGYAEAGLSDARSELREAQASESSATSDSETCSGVSRKIPKTVQRLLGSDRQKAQPRPAPRESSND